MGKHTKGPWIAEIYSRGFSIYDKDSGLIAILNCGLPKNKPDCADANARLIAAAPDLLDAAQAARAILQACGEWHNPIIAPQVKIIEDALKKAGGAE